MTITSAPRETAAPGTAAAGDGHRKHFPWPLRGFLGVKLARAQRDQRPLALATPPSLGGVAGMDGHDGFSYLSGRSRTSAAGTPEAHPTSSWIENADQDCRAALAAHHDVTPIPTVLEFRWTPSKLDAAMAAAALGVGVLSGVLAGGITWWATGEHPHLSALHQHGPR